MAWASLRRGPRRTRADPWARRTFPPAAPNPGLNRSAPISAVEVGQRARRPEEDATRGFDVVTPGVIPATRTVSSARGRAAAASRNCHPSDQGSWDATSRCLAWLADQDRIISRNVPGPKPLDQRRIISAATSRRSSRRTPPVAPITSKPSRDSETWGRPKEPVRRSGERPRPSGWRRDARRRGRLA